jgi:hypothetical protein
MHQAPIKQDLRRVDLRSLNPPLPPTSGEEVKSQGSNLYKQAPGVESVLPPQFLKLLPVSTCQGNVWSVCVCIIDFIQIWL